MAGTFVTAPWPRRLRLREWFEGTGLDFLKGCRGRAVGRDSH